MADATDLAISSLGPPAGTAASGRTPEQLRALAAQFEALLLGQMLKDMRRSMFSDDEKDGGFGGGPLADTIFAELSVALSRSGGMGLTNSLMSPLLSEAGVDPDTATPDALAALAGAELPSSLDLPALTRGAGIAALASGLKLPAVSPELAGAPAPALDRLAAPVTATPVAFTAALPGRVSSAYGWREDPIKGGMKFHKGVDLAMPVGQDVPVARNGVVSFAGSSDGYGLTVVVKHDDRTSTRYAHLSEILVSPGDQVAAGQTIARSGATGRVTGPHLHFEVLEDGHAVDPGGTW